MYNNWQMVKLFGGIYLLYEVYELIKSVVEKNPEGFAPPVAIGFAVLFGAIGLGLIYSYYRDYKKFKQLEKEEAAKAEERDTLASNEEALGETEEETSDHAEVRELSALDESDLEGMKVVDDEDAFE